MADTDVVMHDATEISNSCQWESMPLALLGRCLLSAFEEGDYSFAACTTFSKAMLTASKSLRVSLHNTDYKPGLATVLGWVPAGLSLRMHLFGGLDGEAPASLQPLLRLLSNKGIVLPGMTTLTCEGMLLDTTSRASLEAVFPNLRKLDVKDCQLEPGAQPLSSCSRLKELTLQSGAYHYALDPPALIADPDAWAAQLTNLPATVTSLAVQVDHYPTSFLPSLAGQLTELSLHRGLPVRRDGIPLDVDEQPHWHEAVIFTSQLTALHTLQLDYVQPADIASLAGLPQLRDLEFAMYGSGNNIIGAVLKLRVTHLAMHLSGTEIGPNSPSYADSPCTWKELRLNSTTPELLARLPLHSLTTPLQVSRLIINGDTTLADVQAATANLKRCPAAGPITWMENCTPMIQFDVSDVFEGVWGGGGDDDPATLLRAAAPLLPQNSSSVGILMGMWNAAMLVALQSVLPARVKELTFTYGEFEAGFWPQLARSFPYLEFVTFEGGVTHHSPVSVLSYYLSAVSLQGGRPGALQAASMHMSLDEPENDGLEEGARKCMFDGFREVREQLQFMGFTAQVTIA